MIHTPPSLPIQSNVDLLIVYFFKHLKEDYSLLAMASVARTQQYKDSKGKGHLRFEVCVCIYRLGLFCIINLYYSYRIRKIIRTNTD